MSGKEEMKQLINGLIDLTDENPCNMPDSMFMGIAAAIRFVLNRYTINKQEAADMFGVTTKTIDRWRKDKDFPCDDSNGNKFVSIKLDKLLEWKQKHKQDFIDI